MAYTPYTFKNYYRTIKSHNELAQSAEPTIKKLVRAKRNIHNLPDAWDDKVRCSDVDTKRQIRRSQNNFRDSIRYMVEE